MGVCGGGIVQLAMMSIVTIVEVYSLRPTRVDARIATKYRDSRLRVCNLNYAGWRRGIPAHKLLTQGRSYC